MNDFKIACQIIDIQLGKNIVIALATCQNNIPSVRNVSGYYRNGSIYVVTHKDSLKMQQISSNKEIAFCRGYDPKLPFYEGFLKGFGEGQNIGHPKDVQNTELREELKRIFSAFYDLHVDEEDPGTCILKIKVTRVIIFNGEFKYKIDCRNETVEKYKCQIN